MLRTRRMLLRAPDMQDVEAFHAIMSDPQAMRYWSSDAHRDISQTREYLAGMIAAGPDPDDFIAELHDTPGHPIGKIGFWCPQEVGMLFHPSVWGMGLATEALAILIPRQFARHPSLDAITADIDPRNLASLAVLNKLGFVETGRAEKTFFLNGAWADSLYLALPRAAVQGTIQGAGDIR